MATTTGTKKKVAKRRTAKPSANGKPVVTDEVIEFRIKGGEHDGRTFSMDAMLLKLTCQIVERQHDLASDGDQVFATADFADSLARALSAAGQPSGPAIAIAAWQMVNAYFAECQKKTR